MERGLKIPQKERTKTTSSILVSLLNQLEKDKKSLQLGPDDNLYIEGFASNVFAKADKQDRAGRADINTAKTFYAASIFFEILNQFGELQPDVEQKQKYAAWKAADIRKALKEGRKPEAGPPGGDEDLSIPSDTSNISYDGGSRGNVSADHSGAGLDLPPQTQDRANYQPSSPPPFSRNASSSSPSYPGNPPSSSPSYPTADDFHPVPPPGHRPETSPYSRSHITSRPTPTSTNTHRHKIIHHTRLLPLHKIIHHTRLLPLHKIIRHTRLLPLHKIILRTRLLPLLTHIPISNPTRTILIKASLLFRRTSLTTKILMFPTPTSPLLLCRTILQQLSTVPTAGVALIQNLHDHRHRHSTMTVIINRRQIKLQRLTRQQGLPWGHWHLMMLQ
ncbi:hypothetical protein Syun_026880 [Stephania yunnanensis]|uniref:Vta1/callose synthase N-terminal domain-containing protein n=1 Tax=Stephania yunnanensis TaxID=152371 RepID=A0AAP0EEV9_9MAGN